MALGRDIFRGGLRAGRAILHGLDGAYHRWAGSEGVRGSGNPLVRLAARGGLPPADDPGTQAAQAAALEPHFDAGFYASWYGIAWKDALRDYLREGWRQGRDPRPDFSGADYLAARPYLAAAGINPLLHAIASRRAKGVEAFPRPDPARAARLARRLVDGAFYLAANPDLKAAQVEPADHYMRSGWREGRDPAPGFDTLYYCLDRGIRYADENPLLHLVRHGGPTRLPDPEADAAFRAGTIAPYFDAAYYRGGQCDEDDAGPDAPSDEELILAYAAGGWRDRRSPRQDFDPAGFVQAWAGSRAVTGDPFFRHVAETKLAGAEPFSGEGGVNVPAVDEAWYRATYADVRASGMAPYVHFSSLGWREGRDPGPERSTLCTLLRVCGLAPARPPVEDRAWIGEIGRRAFDREARLGLQGALVALHFDHAFYRERYGIPEDVDAVRDYCDAGWRTGRDPRADFDGWAYRADHPYLEAMDLAPFVHFLATALMRGVDVAAAEFDPHYGEPPSDEAALLDEARIVEADFDADYYRTRNPDVAGASGGPLAHFVAYGQHEGRNPNRHFSIDFYGKTYGHLLAPGESPFLHYVRRGRAAGLMGAPEDLGAWPAMTAPEPADWDGLPPRLPVAQAEILVIMPVYRGRGETLRAIHACLSQPQRTPFTLLVIDDRSPDPVLSQELAQLAARGLFHRVQNPENLGFVASVNRGLALRQGRAVVLLNSDAQVFGDWLDRLAAHARTRPRVASLTPLSNNATICSYPRFDADNAMRLEIDRPDLDAAVARINRGRAVEVPTGVGFCLYMSAEALDAVGPLDAVAFGKGYGEENDWCLRARKAGFSNLLAEDVFVYHAGQVSFGRDPGGEYARGQAALLSKHPDYPGAVAEFVRADPGERTRARIDLYRLARHVRGRAVVFLTHSWGGGIQRHVEDMVARLKAEGTGVVLLSIDRARSLQIDVAYRGREFLYLPTLGSLHLPRDADEIAEFLGWLQPRLVHVHSLAGLRWSAARTLMRLVSECGRPYAWTLHDFSPVCHRNHLVMPDGSYCGLAPVPVCRGCLAADAQGYEEPDPEERRAAFGAFLAGAARVFAPSQDTASRIAGVYPGLAVAVRPHIEADRTVRPMLARRAGRARRVAVLGAINTMKGGRFLQALAQDAKDRALPIRFSIVGHADPALTPDLEALAVTQTGPYAGDNEAIDRVGRAAEQIAETIPHRSDDETLDLAAKISADIVLVPAISPEPHSYDVSLALRTGLPVVAFDLGAQGERLGAYPHGHVLPYALLADPSAFNDRLMQVDIPPRGRLPDPIRAVEYADLLRDYYALETGDVS